MMCKHQAEAKVSKMSGDEATISFTFDASRCQFCKEQAQKQGQKPPEKLTYNARVSQQGQVLSFEEEGGGGGQSQGSEWKNVIMTQARQLVGEGLHQGRLEPEKTYDVSWMRPESWKKGSGGQESGRPAQSSSSGESQQGGKRSTTGGESSSGTTRATAQSGGSGSQRFQLRYEGRTRAEGGQVALFNISSSGGGSSGAGSQSGGSEKSSSESSGAGSSSSRSIDGSGGGSSGGEAGKAAFRLEDGLLEKFALILPASVMKEMHKDEEKSGEAGSMPMGDMLITIRRSQ